jgi:hypothetical protein
LRAWQATPSQDFKTKYEHLLHFFEGAAEFIAIVLLSAFSSNQSLFEPHKQKLAELMKDQNLSFDKATFGAWKCVVEYLGKQTRALLRIDRDGDAVCADIFSDSSNALPRIISNTELAGILSRTNKVRNDWTGHGGIVGDEVAQLRHESLMTEIHKFREVVGDLWTEMELIRAMHCQPREGIFEHEVAVLTGSNGEFLKAKRAMSVWLDVDHLYLWKKNSPRALKLLPLVQVGAFSQSSRSACYFYSRTEKDGLRFVSYHFIDKPEHKVSIQDRAFAALSSLQPCN